MAALLVAAGVYLLLGAAAASLYLALNSEQRSLKDKLQDLAVEARVSQGLFANWQGESGGWGRMLLQWAARRVPNPRIDTPKGERLVQTLVQAGYLHSSAAREFQLARIGCSIAGALIALIAALITRLAGPMVMLWIVVGAAVGAFAPSYLLKRRARQRQDAIARELSDVLDLLVVCVEAGLGLHEAIRIVGSEVEHQGRVIGRELSVVSGEMAAGHSLGQALRAFADRTAVEDVKPLAATLIQSEQLGAQIAPTLRASSDSLRAHRRLRAEETAQKTTVKILFPLVLFVLPAMLIVIIGPAVIQILKTLGN